MKTSELTGAMLDYWVSRADPRCSGLTPEKREGHIVLLGDIEGAKEVCAFICGGGFMSAFSLGAKYRVEHYKPSDSWVQGGPIIERERMKVEPLRDGAWDAYARNSSNEIVGAIGPTLLVAAMRAYVASKFGAQVPDEPQEASNV